ncbi:hypothetical protein [Streptomyces sp. 1268]|uniref:hypothetical protein n=1 Tax=Streptomyces sp. 1268 TaxID=3231942 RepID=UPI0038D4EED4
MEPREPAAVSHSPSTWQQPHPAPASAERNRAWAGSDAESIHRNRYLVAERLYLDEVDPLPRMDVVVDNTDFARPRLKSAKGEAAL